MAEDLSDQDAEDNGEINRDWFLTHVEALANNAFGEDLISVRLDEQDVRIGYVILNSSPEKEIEFDWCDYFIRGKSLFGEEKAFEMMFDLAKFHERDDHT